jgi:3-oxoacyl-[acyl-carrier protein] reductase
MPQTEVQQRYAGRIALVTGSRRGVGKVIADHFLAEGATVIGIAKGDSTCNHENYRHVRADLANPASVSEAFKSLKESASRLDIVVNCAAVLTSQYALIMPLAAAQAMLNVNLLAPFLISREAAKMMRKTKWGRIINISSMAASLEPVGDSVYAATKAGLVTMTNVMAKELASLNVTCNTLAISAIETEMLRQIPRATINRIVEGLPLPRLASADDILNVVDFFASERSSYITAQTVFLGGIN